MAKGKKAKAVTLEEALVPEAEWPHAVPGNWVWTTIKNVSTFERGITFPADAKHSAMGDGLIPCLRTANVQEELRLDNLIYVNRSYMKGNLAKLVRPNDIIMSSANSRELVGKCSFVEEFEQEMTFGGFVLAIRASIVYSRYLFFFLRLEFLFGRFMGESTQTTNIANISTKILGDYTFPLPPLPEQHRIVARIESLFEKLDRARELVQSALDSFETRKAAILHKAFTGELTAQWRAQNHVRMDSWSNSDLDALCVSIVDCPHSTPTWTESGKTCLRTTNFRRGFLDLDEVRYVSEATYIERNQRLKPEPNDILYSREGAILGIACLYPHGLEACLGQRMMLMRTNTDVIPSYLMNYLNSPEILDVVRRKTGGSASPHINIKDIKKFVIPVPTYAEQHEITRILDVTLAKEQDAMEALTATLEQIDLLKKSILARAFRGELGTNDPAE